MRIKLTLLASLCTLLIGFQTAQAQARRGEGDKGAVQTQQAGEWALLQGYVIMGVHGTITVTTPLSQNLTGFQCSDIVVQIGQDKVPTWNGLKIPFVEVVASRKATGDISKGRAATLFQTLPDFP
jgi:hypothetical protein